MFFARFLTLLFLGLPLQVLALEQSESDRFDEHNYFKTPEFRFVFPSLYPDDGRLVLNCSKGNSWFEARVPAMQTQPIENIKGSLKFGGYYKRFFLDSIVVKKTKDIFRDKRILDRQIFFKSLGNNKRLLKELSKSKEVKMRIVFKDMDWVNLNLLYDTSDFSFTQAAEKHCIDK